MLAPGMPRTTPGIVRVRLTKLRPLSGSVLISSSFTVVPSSDDEVWTNGDAPVTVTDSSTAPTSSRALMRRCESTPRSASGTVTVLQPGSSALTMYRPVGSDGAVYSPFESVTTTRTNPVPALVSVMVTLGMTAPVVSVTAPRIVPVTACAASDAGSRQIAAARTRTTLFHSFFTCVLHAPG